MHAYTHIYNYIYSKFKKNLKATTFLILRIFGKGPTACIMGLEVLLLKMTPCAIYGRWGSERIARVSNSFKVTQLQVKKWIPNITHVFIKATTPYWAMKLQPARSHRVDAPWLTVGDVL